MGSGSFFSLKSHVLSHTTPRTNDTWYTLAFLHNIATPLSVLSSLIDDVVPELQPSTATTLQTTVRTLLQSTHLHGASLSGQWRRESFDIVQATRLLAPLLKPLARPYQLILMLPETPTVVLGTPAAWEEILVNLVKNSVGSLYRENQRPRYGKIWLKVVQEKKKWYLYWSDSGIGIPEATWKRIQKPITKHWIPKGHGYGLRSVRFWWKQAFKGEVSLTHQPWWYLKLEAPLGK